jgi:hypothetical protein
MIDHAYCVMVGNYSISTCLPFGELGAAAPALVDGSNTEYVGTHTHS